MKPSLRTALLGAALFLGPVGCSGGHGFLGGDYAPKGNITTVDATSGATIVTSLANPYVVSTGGFTIGIEETNYDGPYTVTMTSWNNGFNEPCFGFVTATSATARTVTTNPSSHVNIVTFSAVNANPPTDPATQANPCVANGTDEETAQISDGKGNTAYFYFVFG
jgi:hypothetical protein